MKIEDVVKDFEKNPCKDCYSLEDYLDYKCVKSFDMYYSGWECDTKSWLMEDGTIFTTNHGHVCEMTPKEFKRYRKQMKKVVEELNEIHETIKSM